MKTPSRNEKWLSDFRNPDARFRGKPLWSWNGRLEPDALRQQIRRMHRMGLGGFFMHSRVGLATPYLSEEWFAAVRASVEEARRLGMEAWLYDEDRWPSGAAGGLVTRRAEYRMRSLEVETIESPRGFRWTPDTLAVFTAHVEDRVRLRGVRRVERGRRPTPADGEAILRFRVAAQAPSPWYNGQTYLDTMNPEAVRAFLRVTHEAYARRFGKDFGGVIPGIFTDEPNYGRTLQENLSDTVVKVRGTPWTPRLPAVFRRRYGYDLLPHLPELVFDVEGITESRARFDYHDCIAFLFTDAFSRQCGEWCQRHGLLFTGHCLEEAGLALQTNVTGSCMRFYEHMQAPGMDILTERRREFITAKQVSSAARQFGRKWRLTETYGCTGWDFPFAGHKAVGDWQAALGINLRCQHLYWYTMLGEAKRDYPASIGHQSPWWEAYTVVEDYFARLHAVITRGVEVRDLLVIHPVESVWLRVRTGWRSDPDVQALDRDFLSVSDRLLEAHLDYDYGDEDLLTRHARVTRRGNTVELRVGRAAYRAVVVPSQLTLRRSTLRLLRDFRARGGLVVFAGRIAHCLDAVPSDAVERFAAEGPRVSADGPDLAAAVAPAVRRVSIADPDGTEIAPALYLLREDAERQYLFVCNTGECFSADAWQSPARNRRLAFPDVRIRAFEGCAGAPMELDPTTGAVYAAEAARDGAGWNLRTDLPPLGSRLFVADRKAAARGPRPAPRPAWSESRRATIPGAPWTIRRSEPNALILDRCSLKIGDGDVEPTGDVLAADRRIRERLGLPPRGGRMRQPWAQAAAKSPRKLPVELRFVFRADARPAGPLALALEQPQAFRITLNGRPVDTDAATGWWTDESLRTLPLNPMALRLGDNTVVLQLDFDERFSGLEALYLLGEFGVRAEGTEVALTALPAALSLGDWCAQGFPFYGGHLTYVRTVRIDAAPDERVFVRLPEYRGVAARIWVDGVAAGILAWEPNEVEITDAARRSEGGEIELGIEILGHRRNSHGPLHFAERWPAWTGPGQFQPSPQDWVDAYQQVPCGLMAAPELLYRRSAVAR